MNKINLNKVPLSELIRIEKEIPKVIAKLKKAEKKALKKKIAALAAESGFDLKELLDNNSPVNRRKKVPPKYQNPNNNTQTWTGRGRKPKWIEEHLNNGGSLDDLLI